MDRHCIWVGREMLALRWWKTCEVLALTMLMASQRSEASGPDWGSE